MYARIFAEKALAISETLATFPEMGRIVPKYNDPYLHEVLYGNYRLVYRLKDGVIELAAICHGAQLLGKILDR